MRSPDEIEAARERLERLHRALWKERLRLAAYVRERGGSWDEDFRRASEELHSRETVMYTQIRMLDWVMGAPRTLVFQHDSAAAAKRFMDQWLEERDDD